MPNIRPYTQQITAGGDIPSRAAGAADFGGDVGEALQRFGHAGNAAAEQINDIEQRREVTDVHTRLAEANAQWTLHLEERGTQAKPEDSTFAPKFNADLSSYVEKLGERYQTEAGRQAFAKGSGELRAHFAQQSGIFQSRLAGVHATQQYGTFLNAQRSALVSDPTQFDRLLAMTTQALNDPSGAYARIPAAKRAELLESTQRQMALSAVQGLTVNGAPDLAKRQLMGGQWDKYLDADQKKQLLGEADVALRAQDTAEERRRLTAEYERKQAQERTMGSMLDRVVNPNPENGGTLSDQEILRDPTLDSTHKQHLIDYKLRRIRELAASGEPKTNPAAVRDLMLQIHADADDPRKTFNMDPVMAAYRDSKISTPEMQMLRKEVEQLRDGNTSGFQKDMQNARNAVYMSITRSIIGQTQPEVAADAAYRFNRDLEVAVAAKREKNEDPRTLLTPGHKDYLMSPERIQSYLRPARGVVAAQAAAVPGAAVPQSGTRVAKGVIERPSEFDPVFAAAAKKHGVDAGDLKRLAITESSLNPNAINAQDGSGGSFGLMQINGQHLGTFGVTQEQLMLPETNIEIGAQIWKQALAAAKGDKNKAVEFYKGAKTPAGRARIADQAQFITKTYKDHASLKPGEQYLDPQGNVRTKQ